MSQSSRFFVLFSKLVSLDDAAGALREAGVVVERGAGVLSVNQRGVKMEIGLSSDAHVAAESIELAERLAVPDAARCTRRFEVLVADLGTALGEYNTMQSVQETLIEVTDGLAWLQWNDGII